MSFFKPEDFGSPNPLDFNMRIPCAIAEIANKLLEDRGAMFYGTTDGFWSKTNNAMDTHQALLVNIEELAKEECLHEKILVPTRCTFEEAMKVIMCADCHKKLVAEWKPA